MYYNITLDSINKQLNERVKNSKRLDDTFETIKKRLSNYQDQTLPLYDYYKVFGRVREIDGSIDPSEMYNITRLAIMPQTVFIIGPQASGKTTIGEKLEGRTNMKRINFNDFLKEKAIRGKDDETVTQTLIMSLASEVKPRVVIENFPQNELQAKFFNLNCKPPSSVFILNCPSDICQERMNDLGESDPNYVCSGILSQKIKEYNQKSKNLIPFLKKHNNATEVDSSQTFEKMMNAVYDQVEPFVIHIRPGAASNDLRKQITEKLSTEHGFINLDINALIRDENERKTPIGEEIH